MADQKLNIPGWHGPDHPDLEWWAQQIEEGIQWRDANAYMQKHQRWDKMYKNEYSNVPMPINLFFMMVRTLIPRLYFRNPSISVTPSQAGPQQLGLSVLMERLDNRLIRTMGMKREMKRVIQECFFHGNGIGKLGYGSEYVTPMGEVARTASKKKPWFNVDYRAGIRPDMPWFMAVPYGQYVLPARSIDRLSAPWECHIIWRDMDELKADSRFKVDKDLGPSHKDTQLEFDNLVETREIHDRRTGKVFVYVPHEDDSKKVILAPTADDFQSMRGGPFYDVTFNEVCGSAIGVPDAQYLEPFQHELNKLSTAIMQHAWMTNRKFIATHEGLSEAEAESLVNGPLGVVVFVNEMNEINTITAGGVPPELVSLLDKLMQIVQYTIGFSRNEFGDYRPGSESPTATEANIVRMASEIRVDERRDMLADMLVNVMSDTNRTIARHWTENKIEQVAGPFGVPVWVEFSGAMLQEAQYELYIDPDSSVPETKESREAKAVGLFDRLYPLSQQADVRTGMPLVDSTKLTRFLLHELQGVEYDDMLMGVPNIYDERFVRALTQGDQNLQAPVSPEQLGQMFNNAPAGGVALASMFNQEMQ